MEPYVILAIPILLATCWFYTVAVAKRSFPTLRGKRICLLIAHPDDEAMFFNPTLQALNAPELGNHLKVLCLSSGDADGLGSIRKHELLRSTSMLGLHSLDDVLILEDDNFPDSMSASWSSEKIANCLTYAFASEEALEQAAMIAKVKKQKIGTGIDAPVATIDALITFDQGGVSGHVNHISLFHGAVEWVQGLMKGKAGYDEAVKVYTLTSTNVLRKYMSGFDAPVTIAKCVLDSMRRTAGTKAAKRGKTKGGRASGGSREDPDFPGRLMFMNGFSEVRTGQSCMTHAHQSQMRWFRWGWIFASRYMVVNDLKRAKIT
ncbi:N-acetylglucosaminyl-phosphatidylinositol de-N-acetylase [Agyrium rufum]|nr:N-acetylglucosaminyl-phosphatidylinositol de-N-acetylase [Agyrium rufum]